MVNNLYWLFGATALSLAVAVYATVTGNRLEADQRKMRIRKFGLIAVAVWLYGMTIFTPYISPFSRVEYLERIQIEKQDTIEGVNQVDAQQTRNIEALKDEVNRLRNDLDRTNEYYSFAMRLVASLIAISCLVLAFTSYDSRPRKDDQIHLNLND